MIKDTDLHLYLAEPPEVESLEEVLSVYGLLLTKIVDKTKSEPRSHFFKWSMPTSYGFQLVYFETLFSDDLNSGKYGAFVMLSAGQESSVADLTALDITASSLVSTYGGRLHNPHRIERISTSYLLSGTQFSPNASI